MEPSEVSHLERPPPEHLGIGHLVAALPVPARDDTH